ncbi:MAG: nucleoside permease [Saprospiraceae bacterium]|nr:nucleoside permease [Saprospiraceae bacterium]
MKQSTRIQLSVMMFLNFFIWGGWFVTMGTYLGQQLGASGTETGIAYGTQSWGAIIAPFIIGLIADRFFAAQKILGVLHLVGAALMWYISIAPGFGQFFPALLVYMICYMPTLALVNAISFRQMGNPEKEFPSIRVLGTIGWIVANLIIGWLAWEKNGTLELTFKMTAIASLGLGIFSFMLPNTPPPKAGQTVSIGDIVGLDALSMLKSPSYLVFFLASVAICIPLAFYYSFANPFLNELGVEAAASKQSLGQVSEVLFMLLMPVIFVRWGVKKMLLVGMGAWILRYILFAYGDNDSGYWMLLLGILLHGICYDFFFVTGQIYTDKFAGEKYKSAAQGLITLATYGIGMLIGYSISGVVADMYKTGENAHNWFNIWMVPAGIAAAVLLVFAFMFKDNKSNG